MKIMTKIIFLFLILTATNSISQVKSIDSERLVKMMEGSYSSEEQSKNDTDYFDIRLYIKRVWSYRTDGKWLYFEEVEASDPDKPHRQGVYRITNTYEGRFESAVFTLNDPLRFADEWKKENSLSGLIPDSLNLMKGCAVTFTLMNDGSYKGSTEGKYCANDHKGGKYSTSEVKLSQDGIISWNKGFDENDKMVWGVAKGGYVFKRVE